MHIYLYVYLRSYRYNTHTHTYARPQIYTYVRILRHYYAYNDYVYKVWQVQSVGYCGPKLDRKRAARGATHNVFPITFPRACDDDDDDDATAAQHSRVLPKYLYSDYNTRQYAFIYIYITHFVTTMLRRTIHAIRKIERFRPRVIYVVQRRIIRIVDSEDIFTRREFKVRPLNVLAIITPV